jgi:hypothetical protein
MVAQYAVGDRRKVIANRGLSGIDGTVSTAIGAALGRPSSTRSMALMGDVTFLHDATALMAGPREERPDLTLVVVNDDGGSIFAIRRRRGRRGTGTSRQPARAGRADPGPAAVTATPGGQPRSSGRPSGDAGSWS